jgi:hypothetical protein
VPASVTDDLFKRRRPSRRTCIARCYTTPRIAFQIT